MRNTIHGELQHAFETKFTQIHANSRKAFPGASFHVETHANSRKLTRIVAYGIRFGIRSNPEAYLFAGVLQVEKHEELIMQLPYRIL